MGTGGFSQGHAVCEAARAGVKQALAMRLEYWGEVREGGVDKGNVYVVWMQLKQKLVKSLREDAKENGV